MISSLVMLAPSASAAPVAVINERIGNMVVFEQDYTATKHVPGNVILGHVQSTAPVLNYTLEYDYLDPSIMLSAGQNANGLVFVGGLMPAIQTNISMEVEFTRSLATGARLLVYAGGAQLQLALVDGTPPGSLDRMMVRSAYYDDTGALTGKYVNLELETADETSWRKSITIRSNGLNGTNIFYVDGKEILSTPMFWLNHISYGGLYSYFANPHIRFGFDSLNTEGAEATAKIYSITQTVPEYQYITPISDPMVQPLGLDGPHPWTYVDDGIAYVESKGGRGTIWADVDYVSTYPPENLTRLLDLIDRGWELGIHVRSLQGMTTSEAISKINEDYDTISEFFGRAPTSWCSTGNGETAALAAYAWANLGMVWRNDANGVGSGVPNLVKTGLYDTNMFIRGPLSEAGVIMPIYTHRLDEEVAQEFSISCGNFTAWVDNYADNGITIVPLYDYWTLGQNTGHTVISDLTVDDGRSLSFTLDNIGKKSRVFVAAPSAEVVTDADGNEVPFTAVDGGIIMEVEAGEYQVMTMSAYRADQIDRAISPLYTVIPVVIGLAVIGGLITMIGRIKL